MSRVNAAKSDAYFDQEERDIECRRVAIKITLYVIGVLFIAGGIALHLNAEEGNLAGLILFGSTGISFILSAICCFQKEVKPPPIPKYIPPEIAIADELERFLRGDLEELSRENITQLHLYPGAHANYYAVLKKRLIKAVQAEIASLGDEHAVFKAEIQKVCKDNLIEVTRKSKKGNFLLIGAIKLKLPKTEWLLLESGAKKGLAEEMANPDLDPNFVKAIQDLIDGAANDPNLKIEVPGTSFEKLNLTDPSSFALLRWMIGIPEPATKAKVKDCLAKPFNLSLLHFAYANGLIEVATFLKGKGAEEGPLEELEYLSKTFDSDRQNNRYNHNFVRCLQMICRGCDFSVDKCYNYECDSDNRMWISLSLLEWAIAEKCFKTAWMLIERKAQIGCLAILSAAEKKQFSMVTKLLEIDCDFDAIAQLIEKYGDVAEIRKILDDLMGSIDLNEQDKDGNTPLHRFLEAKNYPMVDLLITHGANLNIPNHNLLETPAEIARRQGKSLKPAAPAFIPSLD